MTTTTVDDLITFLRARENEREAAANAGHGVHCASLDSCYEQNGDLPDYGRCDCPKRWTLDDVAAKRQIIELHTPDWPWNKACGCCGEAALCRTLRLLALPYDEHPDYREEWRP
ncbi:DUF6221 family protein [Amycolatopsis sp. NPDC051373]|uniref:DUF6221 family protein n=1 Tax=Amycolatopsis sp. NPDC051373 TaxID=3155801 RepID=UPI0034510E27